MRWTIALFVIAVGLIHDAMYFNGYYRGQGVVVIERSINFLSDLAHR